MMPYIDEEIAMYLSAPENPLDIKAAVINAIGWETKGAESIVQIDYDTGYTYGEKQRQTVLRFCFWKAFGRFGF